jgi:signal transduction histidine kinase
LLCNRTPIFLSSSLGIDYDILPGLFTKFATRSDVGTGLGLYISKSIIEAHSSGIWAKNNPDRKGATFAFTLHTSFFYYSTLLINICEIGESL